MKSLRISPNLAIGDLPSIVASEAGFFEEEGLSVTIVDKDLRDNSQQGVFERQKERLFEERNANLYNACLWGSIHRAFHSQRPVLLVQRRSCVFPVAVAIHADSRIRVPEDLRDVAVAVSDITGSYYMTYRMLGGFLNREEIRPIHIGHPNHRLDALARHDVEAAVLIEPYISLAEKQGYRVLMEAAFWGLELCDGVMTEADAEGYRRALSKAVDLINGDLGRYLPIVIEREGLAGVLEVTDLRMSRYRYVYPEPLSEPFVESTVAWMKEQNHLDPNVTSEAFIRKILGLRSFVGAA